MKCFGMLGLAVGTPFKNFIPKGLRPRISFDGSYEAKDERAARGVCRVQPFCVFLSHSVLYAFVAYMFSLFVCLSQY